MKLLEDASIKYQHKKLRTMYKEEIKNLTEWRSDRFDLCRRLFGMWGPNNSGKGYYSLLPYCFILDGDYEMAWILFFYLKLGFCGEAAWYKEIGKKELETSELFDFKPIYNNEEMAKNMSYRYGATCFRLNEPFPEDERFVEDREMGYDMTPEARHRTIDSTRNYPLIHSSYYRAIRRLEIFARQEKVAESDECLFRLRHILSLGKAPSYLISFSPNQLLTPSVNMYDYWLQARREAEPERRKRLAVNAFYWFLERGIRYFGKDAIEGMHPFCDGCEIIGEFELMEEDQINFLRHLKRLTTHASISHCRKMMNDPVPMIPFEERGTPGFDEYGKFRIESLQNKKKPGAMP